ncbi:MAG: glycosyltransferase family 2 protein [Oscillospiraceae bacterium]|jgi:glycosyltransferase involved in cell wall biosynthesis|nr:glycosyltransferase family 2 protein [Oscillospiraceae bacterium]
MPGTVVLIPCFNEAPTIGKVVSDYKNLLPEARIMVFDNNSTDGSGALARAAGAEVVPVYRQGKGFVIVEMFRDVDADVYLMVDGDDTYNASDTAALVTPVLEGRADMVIGDRLSSTYFTENKRRFHNSGNRFVRFLVNFLFKSRIRDIMTGARAFSRRFVQGFPVMSSGFEIETEMTIHALDKKMMIAEQSVGYSDRPAGSVSKLNTFSDGMRVLKTIFTLFKDYKPLAFFGTISVIALLIAAAMFIPVLIDYIETGLVAKFPTLIVSVGFGVLSLLSFACGCILDTIKKYSDRTMMMIANLTARK